MDEAAVKLLPSPIFASRLLSEPVFFSIISGPGIERAVVPRCNCCSRAYCSCNAFCLRRSS